MGKHDTWDHYKLRAESMRREGSSYAEIALTIGMSRSDLLYWMESKLFESKSYTPPTKHDYLPDEWYAERLERGECELTGIRFVTDCWSPWNPVVTMAHSSRGMVPNNCFLTARIVRDAKADYTLETLMRMCRALSP